MTIRELLRKIKTVRTEGSLDCDVTGIHIDSRRVGRGHLFVAIKGTQADGHQFITKAEELGAAAVVCEDMPQTLKEGVAYIQVDSTDSVVGQLATTFYGDPSAKLKLVGITGTNGKTTIATLLYNMFRKMGHRCGLLSTVCNYIEDVAIPASHTTPDPIELNKLLAQMVENGCEYVFMECSSHAIAQKRIGGLHFSGGVFTNLTRDHLDYHKTVEAYRDAKKTFFDMLPKTAFALVNADDKNGAFMVQNTKATTKTYSIRKSADYKARIVECHFEGMYLEVDGREVGVQFIGKFNVSNLLAVYGTAVLLGKKAEDILLVMSTLKSVSGRLEPLYSPDGYTAVVDYAHTPDALANVLNAIHEVLNGKGKIITVCGAGGNRDAGKRPLMAKEAARQSDKVILTSDNPRFEDPQAIINDMMRGISTPQDQKKTLSIADRKEAIKTACMLAAKGDVVLVAGKGHEDYQEINGVKHHFDDKEVLQEIFNSQMQTS